VALSSQVMLGPVTETRWLVVQTVLVQKRASLKRSDAVSAFRAPCASCLMASPTTAEHSAPDEDAQGFGD